MAEFATKHHEESELTVVTQPVSQQPQWSPQQNAPWANNPPPPGPQYQQPQWAQPQGPPGYPQLGYPPQPGFPPPQQPGFPPQQMGQATQSMSTNNTIIITGQPGASGPTLPRDWSSGLCDCCSDPGTCCMAHCCPLCLQTSIAQDMGETCCNACCYVYCGAMTLFGLRVYMRGRQNIQGSLCDDFSKASFCNLCYCCVLAQLAREVKHVKKTKGYF